MNLYTKTLSDTESKNKQFYLVDVFKFIFALLIVSIHIPPLSTYSELANYIIRNYFARMAVPFYFIASGFFLFRKLSYNKFDVKVPLKYAKRILMLYVIWTFIYLPLTIRNLLQNDGNLIYSIYIWARNSIFSESYAHLWYLNALVVATLMLTFCFFIKMKVNAIIFLGVILYAIGLLPQSYSILLQPLSNHELIWKCLKFTQTIISTTRNGFFEGFLLMGIGMLYAYKPILLKFRTAVIGLVLSMLSLLIEILAVHNLRWALEYDMYVFLVPTSFFLFYVVTHIEISYKPIYKQLRELGILIFLIHLLIKELIDWGMSIIASDNSLLQYTATVLVSIIISRCIIKLSYYSIFKWIKKIYS